MTLPNFLICGAGKSGSTTLWAVLRRHPQVFMPFDKEPKYFTGEERNRSNHGLGLAWYESLFAPATDEVAIGEASMSYFFDIDTPRLIHETLGTPKLVFILRDPSERALSHYWGERRRGEQLPPFAEVVARRLPPYDKFVRTGSYATNMKRFLAYHPRDSMLFLRFEDLRRDPAALFARLCAFLEIDPALLDLDDDEQHNRAAVPRSDRLEKILRHFPFKRRIRVLLSDRVISLCRRGLLVAKRLNRRPIEKQVMDAATRALLVAQFRDEIEELEGLLEWNLDAWKRVTP